MATGTAPTSQKNRPISFLLDDRANGASPEWLQLNIRPEDLSRSEPSRSTTHQTLAGDAAGWIDSFGRGLPQISISGHTGWRDPLGGTEDGAARFEALHELIVDKYHRRRQQAVDRGVNPDGVKLIFSDVLDDFCWEVYPQSFSLRRSKARPLLMQYAIQLQVVSFEVEYVAADVNIDNLLAGLESLGGVASGLSGMIGSVVSSVQSFLRPIANGVKAFLGLTAGVFTAVHSVVGSVLGGTRTVANDLIGIARDLAQAGRNVFNTIADVATLPGRVRQQFQEVAAAYNTAYCLFRNALRANNRVYQDYTSVYGSSNCSSTTGGTPPSQFADSNVFEYLRPAPAPLSLSSDAAGSIAALSKCDPVLSPLPVAEVGRHLTNISPGFGGFGSDFTASVASVGSGLLDGANSIFGGMAA